LLREVVSSVPVGGDSSDEELSSLSAGEATNCAQEIDISDQQLTKVAPAIKDTIRVGTGFL
jgi:hypothetical protein